MATGDDLETTSSHHQNNQKILSMHLPDYRAAYSDRLVWLMACFSELSYLKFDEFLAGNVKQSFIDKLEKLAGAERLTDSSSKKLIALINDFTYDHTAEAKKLETLTGNVRYKLLETFNDPETGTQAILAGDDERLVLAFRGTETDSFKDIKTDADAEPVPCESGGKVHGGFLKAYGSIANDIDKALSDPARSGLPLYITGHSLGGALATVAAKLLEHDGGIAACVTFGSPRVGDENWVGGLKTPVYRLVNAADVVTMLPPNDLFIRVFAWITSFIPLVGRKIRTFLINKYGGYLHGGNMRYLTNCPTNDFKEVKLLYSVDLLYRLKGLIWQNLPFTNLLSDHKIATYRRKLEVIAIKRNP